MFTITNNTDKTQKIQCNSGESWDVEAGQSLNLAPEHMAAGIEVTPE